MKNKKSSLRKAEVALQKYYDKIGISKDKVPSPHRVPSYKSEDKQYPSKGTGIGNSSKKTQNVYTGTDIVGIATMHKSNAVPIRRGTNEAIEIAQMGS